MGNKCHKTCKDFTLLTEQQIDFLIKNTPCDRNQIIEWHKGFLRDVPDGRMTRYKFIQFYRLLYPNGKVEKFCKRIFKVFDSDNSGEIDFVELMTAISVTASCDMKQKITLAFKLFDVDGSGKITREELIEVIESIYDLTIHEKDFKRRKDTRELVDLVIEKFDSNNDNFLAKDEFFKFCLDNPNYAEIIIPYG